MRVHGGVVGVGEEGVLDDDAAAPTRLEDFDEVLEEERGRLAGADGEVLLNFFALRTAEGRIGEHDVVAVLFLNVGEVFGEGVGVDNVRRNEVSCGATQARTLEAVTRRAVIAAEQSVSLGRQFDNTRSDRCTA
jgi:hypothetical protein